MANPNIASLSELQVGTLGFNVKTNQVIFHSLSSGYNDGGSSASWTHKVDFSQLGKTFTNNIVLVSTQPFGGSSNNTGMTSGSWNSDALTRLPDLNKHISPHTSYAYSALFYRVNPDEVTSTANVYGAWTSNNQNITYISHVYSNVDQTNPFKTLNTAGGHLYTGTPNYNGDGIFSKEGQNDVISQWYDNSLVSLINQNDFDCEYGDLGIIHFTGADNGMSACGIGSYNAGGISGNWGANQSIFLTPSYAGSGHCVPLSQIYTDTGASGRGPGVTAGYSHYYAVTLQSPQTKDTLFECPSDRVIKVNSIKLANPEMHGIRVNIDLDGLGAINDSSGSAAVTPTGNDATVAIATGVKAKMGSATEVLEKPFYMVEGDQLKANAKHWGFTPQFANLNVDIIISFETMED